MLERRIAALDSREDEVYRKWRNDYHELRYRAPTVTRLFQVTFRIAPANRGRSAKDPAHRGLASGTAVSVFPEEAQKKLSRARMDVIARILDVARRNSVNAVLCAGDLFDDPTPARTSGRASPRRFAITPATHPPVFLVPGNHDPLTSESVWAPSHPFRRNFRRGCMSSTRMISPMNLRLMQSSMRARAGRRPERTTWRWRFPPANPVTREYASDASMAARSTWTAIRPTSRFVAMRACIVGSTISRSVTRIHSVTSPRLRPSRPYTPVRLNPRTSTSPARAAWLSLRSSGTGRGLA